MSVVAELGVEVSREEGEVIDWRLRELERAGYGPGEAIVVALNTDVDLHGACALVRRGCDPATALRILL